MVVNTWMKCDTHILCMLHSTYKYSFMQPIIANIPYIIGTNKIYMNWRFRTICNKEKRTIVTIPRLGWRINDVSVVFISNVARWAFPFTTHMPCIVHVPWCTGNVHMLSGCRTQQNKEHEPRYFYVEHAFNRCCSIKIRNCASTYTRVRYKA